MNQDKRSLCRGCRDGAGTGFDFTMAFQPIVDLETGRAYAYEALVRGPGGESAASVLAQVTDENRYAFDQQCRVKAIEGAVGAGLLDGEAKLSINFLPNAVYSPVACIQLTLRTAAAIGLPTSRLIFEFTENEQMVDPAHVRDIIETYRRMGFGTAIDDFGAGHAGLGLLANFQTDAVKLDMELVRGIDCNLPRRLIVEALVRMCRDMGIRLIAEGVETAGELAALRAAGVRFAQGYLFARAEIGRLPTVTLAPVTEARAA